MKRGGGSASAIRSPGRLPGPGIELSPIPGQSCIYSLEPIFAPSSLPKIGVGSGLASKEFARECNEQ